MIDFPKLSRLPREARVWLYAADRELTLAEKDLVMTRLTAFMDTWSSHGRAVLGAAEFAENRLLGIAAVVEEAEISGCGIDKSVRVLDGIAKSMGMEWLSGLSIAYRNRDGKLEVTDRSSFRSAVRSGLVTPETPVIDLAVQYTADLQQVERPMRDSWHAQAFGLASPEAAA